ncbi:HGxxPAAW family protein [Streptomyces sp. NPDC005017]|uniref:HGxxPAAW family protein n=1 Tax=Streptomyces sp. NPDC005017 TaxID=3364706 RepID=UPI00367B9A9D
MFVHEEVDMGHTVAGWTGSATALAGFALSGTAVVAGSAHLAVAGAAVVLGALPVTWMLHLAGWGKPSGPRPADQWDWRVRDRAARSGHPDCLGCRLAGRRAATTPRRLAEPAAPDARVRPDVQPAG